MRRFESFRPNYKEPVKRNHSKRNQLKGTRLLAELFKKSGDLEAVLFSGSSHPELAKAIASSSGVPLGALKRTRFPDGEISVEVLESVRGKHVFVLQSVALNPSEHLMELLIIVDALKRASAKAIIAVIPYFGYSRQDRKDRPRTPITAKLVANLIATAGVTRIVTMDLHAEQIQGFFDIPVDHLYGRIPLLSALKEELFKNDLQSDLKKNLVIVAPDVGSVKIARSYAEEIGVDFAVIDKHRVNSSQVEVMHIIGDVKGKDVLLADDICSTGSTLASAAKACQEKGSRKVYAAVTHGLFVGNAVKAIRESAIDRFFVTDTIAFQKNTEGLNNLSVVPVAGLFGLALQCTLSNKSISSLFEK